jgi:hypothetical protein
MKIEIDPTLMKFELKSLLANRVTLFQAAFLQWYFVSSFPGKKALAACDALFWANYGLFVCTTIASVMGAICVGYVLTQPKSNGMLELMLSSPLSLRRLMLTTLAVCFIFSAGGLALHLAVLHAVYGVVPAGAGFYLASAAALAFSFLTLLGSVVFAFGTKDIHQLHVVVMMLGMVFWIAGIFTGLRLAVPLWLAPSLIAFFLALSGILWNLAPRLISKEKAVLA